MTTAFRQLAVAAKQALTVAAVSPNVMGGTGRVTQQMATAVLVRLVSADLDQGAGRAPRTPGATVLVLECYARQTDGMGADDAVDAVLQAVHTALMADPTLQGHAAGLRLQSVTWDDDIDGERTCCAIATYSTRHSVSAANLT